MDNQKLIERLKRPVGKKIDVVIDSDTFNEIDDQYAIAYAIKNPDKLNIEAIYAAPFWTDRWAFMAAKAKSPKEGMEKSYNEIFNILKLLGESKYNDVVYRGSDRYLPSETQFVESEAARDLVKRAMARDDDNPLYVIALGAITNIASAILMEPKIIEKIVIVWLGGHAWHWHDTDEFNMMQDIAAARVVFDSMAPVVQLPCMGVVSAFTATGAELNHYLKGKNELCDYLVDITTKEAAGWGYTEYWSRAIWDVTPVAWLLDEDFCLDRLDHSPLPQYDFQYSFNPSRHLMRYVYGIKRDDLVADLFKKLAQ